MFWKATFMFKLKTIILKPICLQLHTIRFMTHKVFVYGTLKRGEPNHYWLQSPENGVGKYLIDGFTKTKYPLVIATKYNIPFLLYSPGQGCNVYGEIYEVDDKMLSNLDILEDHPKYYVRQQDEIVIHNSASKPETIKCWVYFLKNFKQELLKKPCLFTYNSNGPHGLPYMDRSQRDPLNDFRSEIKNDLLK